MKSILHKHAGIFNYHQKAIPFHYWSHLSDQSSSIDTVIFLGSGQTGKITQWVAKNAPIGTAIVEGLPHKEADRSAYDLKEFARDYTITALFLVLKRYELSTINIVAESQAAPGVIWASLDHPDKVKNVALIAPLGFTADMLGESPRQRLRELKKRAFLSTMQRAQSPLYDWRNAYLSVLMLYVVMFDARWKVSGQKYAIGASHDIREDCRELSIILHRQGNKLVFVLGTRDRLFPAHEVTASINKAKIRYTTVALLKASHASLAIRNGRSILRQALELIR